MEADEPFTGDAVAVGFRRGELPAACGFQGKISEILTGAGRIECCLGDISSGIDLHADADADNPLNGGEGFFGDVRQNLIENFAARG